MSRLGTPQAMRLHIFRRNLFRGRLGGWQVRSRGGSCAKVQMLTFDELFRVLDGRLLSEVSDYIDADGVLAAVNAYRQRCDDSAALGLLDSAILQARAALRATVFGIADLSKGGFNLLGYLVDLHCRRGRLYLARSDFRLARADFLAARVLMPDHPYPQPLLIEVYEKMGRWDLAISLLLRIHQADPESLGIAMLTLTAFARQAGAPLDVLRPGLVAAKVSDSTNLFAALVDAHLQAPGEQPPSRAQVEQGFVHAFAAFNARDYAEAATALVYPLAWSPQLAQGWLALGEINFQIDEDSIFMPEPGPAAAVVQSLEPGPEIGLRTAERAFHIAVGLDPGLADGWRRLVQARFFLGDLLGAIDAGWHAVSLLPDDAASHMALGVSLYLVGDVDRAKEVLQRALELDPDVPLAQGFLDAAQHPGEETRPS